jgi:membrane protease YdiL (CAAX protease family)
MAFFVVFASLLIRTPDVDSPMKALLSDPVSAILLALLGVTVGPICEEIVFRGFLQPLLVRSLGPLPGVLVAAVPFGLLHLQEYGYSWRHALLITLAGASFGWMRYRTGSTKAAALMHASYNGVFFMVLVLQQVAVHGRWTGYAK